MILPDAKITLDTGVFGTRGFTFSILGDEPSDGSEAPERSQGENPVFTADYNNNPFESGKIYLLTSFHPDYMDPTVVGRAVFNELGGVTFVSSAEAPSTTAAGSDVSTGYPHAEYQLTDPVSGQVSTWQWSELRQKFILVNSTIPIDPDLRQVLTAGNEAEQSIILKGGPAGNPQVFFKQGPTPSFQGLSFLDASHADRGVMGFDTDGGIVFVKDGKYVSKWTATQMEMLLEVFNAFSAKGIFQSLATTSLQSSTAYQSIAVHELDVSTGQYRIKSDTLANSWIRGFTANNKAEIATALAPFFAGQSVEGDARLVEEVYCYTEVAQLNEQYFPITYSMFGVPQNHSLNTPGSGIYSSIQNDVDKGGAPYLTIDYSGSTQFRVILIDGDAVDSTWTGELYLRKKVQGSVVTGGGIRYLIRVTKLTSELAPDPGLGHPTGKMLYLLPAGFLPPAEGTVVKPLGSGWTPYTGLFSALGTDCIETPPPVSGAPSFNALNPTAITPGGFYEWIFDIDAATNPGGVGLSVTVQAGDSHPYLNFDYPATGKARIFGNVPPSVSANVLYPLVAVQSDGKTATAVATILLATQVVMYLAVQQYVAGSSRTLVLRGGGDFGAEDTKLPWETLSGPSAFTGRGRERMKRYGANILSTEFYYDEPPFINAPAGTYSVSYESPDGRIKYGSFVLGSTAMAQIITLSDTPPVVAPVDVAVLNVDYSFQHNNPPSVQTNLYVFLKTNGGAGTVTMAIEGVGPTSDYILPKSSYSAFAGGDFGSGYNLRISIAGIAPGAVEKLYIKPSVGSEIVLPITLPATGDKDRNTIYPAGPAPVITHTLYESLL